jgi:hypothetical protein
MRSKQLSAFSYQLSAAISLVKLAIIGEVGHELKADS